MNISIMAAVLTVLLLALVIPDAALAQPRNLTVTIYGPERYSDIWVGISTGGYDVIAEKGKELEFRVFVKNGMSDRSLHNIKLIPNDFPFDIRDIAPKQIEQLKPMEIVIFRVTCLVPEDALSGKHRYTFDLAADEFPAGIFSLRDEIKVLDRIKVELYGLYLLISILILVALFYRKWKLANQGKKHSGKQPRKSL